MSNKFSSTPTSPLVHCMHANLLQLCPALCDPMDRSTLGSWVHGILQTRMLQWVATPSSRGSSPPRDRSHISCISCFGRQIHYHCYHLGSPMVLYLISYFFRKKKPVRKVLNNGVCIHKGQPPRAQTEWRRMKGRSIEASGDYPAALPWQVFSAIQTQKTLIFIPLAQGLPWWSSG